MASHDIIWLEFKPQSAAHLCHAHTVFNKKITLNKVKLSDLTLILAPESWSCGTERPGFLQGQSSGCKLTNAYDFECSGIPTRYTSQVSSLRFSDAMGLFGQEVWNAQRRRKFRSRESQKRGSLEAQRFRGFRGSWKMTFLDGSVGAQRFRAWRARSCRGSWILRLTCSKIPSLVCSEARELWGSNARRFREFGGSRLVGSEARGSWKSWFLKVVGSEAREPWDPWALRFQVLEGLEAQELWRSSAREFRDSEVPGSRGLEPRWFCTGRFWGLWALRLSVIRGLEGPEFWVKVLGDLKTREFWGSRCRSLVSLAEFVSSGSWAPRPVSSENPCFPRFTWLGSWGSWALKFACS